MRPKYKVEIDFEESSREWMKNKTKLPNGVYRYRCEHFSESKQKYCKRKVHFNGLCKYHYLHHDKTF